MSTPAGVTVQYEDFASRLLPLLRTVTIFPRFNPEYTQLAAVIGHFYLLEALEYCAKVTRPDNCFCWENEDDDDTFDCLIDIFRTVKFTGMVTTEVCRGDETRYAGKSFAKLVELLNGCASQRRIRRVIKTDLQQYNTRVDG
jgi:hypothetical protein